MLQGKVGKKRLWVASSDVQIPCGKGFVPLRGVAHFIRQHAVEDVQLLSEKHGVDFHVEVLVDLHMADGSIRPQWRREA